MTCPHCQKELPQDLEGERCPFCGNESRTFDVGLNPKRLGLAPRQIQFNWWPFLLALLLPPSLTQLSAFILGHLVGRLNDDGTVCGVVGTVGGIVGGIICGVMLANCVGTSPPAKVVLSIVFSGIMIVVCLALCCFGCAVGYGGSRL